jgi:hypothetical protein
LSLTLYTHVESACAVQQMEALNAGGVDIWGTDMSGGRCGLYYGLLIRAFFLSFFFTPIFRSSEILSIISVNTRFFKYVVEVSFVQNITKLV